VAFGGSWHWLAPAMGCFLLLLLVLNPRDGRMNDWTIADSHLPADMISGPQTMAAYLTAQSHSKQNGIGHETLEWTNEQRAFSGINALPLAMTNSLLR
jgi:hypothetical protein